MNSNKIKAVKKLSKILSIALNKENIDIKQSKLLDLFSHFYGYKNFNTFISMENKKSIINNEKAFLRCISKDDLKYQNTRFIESKINHKFNFKHIKLINKYGLMNEDTGIYCVNFNDPIHGDILIKDENMVSICGIPVEYINNNLSQIILSDIDKLSSFLSSKIKNLSCLKINLILSEVMKTKNIEINEIKFHNFLDYFKITYDGRDYYLRKNDKFKDLGIEPILKGSEHRNYVLDFSNITDIKFDEFSDQFIINGLFFDIIKNYNVKTYSFDWFEENYETIIINNHLKFNIEKIKRDNYQLALSDSFTNQWQVVLMGKLRYYKVNKNNDKLVDRNSMFGVDFIEPKEFILDQEQKIIEIVFKTKYEHYYSITQFSYI